MENTKILICDEDAAYVHALVIYLIGSNMGFEIRSHTTISNFDSSGEYDIGLMTEPFIKRYEAIDQNALHIKTILHLAGSKDAGNDYETLYKYQSMDNFIEKIKIAGQKRTAQKRINDSITKRLTGIISPAHHELLLPYAVTVSKILGEKAKTLLVDLEQCSILTHLLGKETARDLTDLMYLITSGKPEQIPDEYLGFYESFYYLLPKRLNLKSTSDADKMWGTLFDYIYSLDFENIVVVYDSILPGTEDILLSSDEIFLVKKPGAVNEIFENIYRNSLMNAGVWDRTKEITIPGSAINALPQNGMLGPMLTGALGSYFMYQGAAQNGA
ncbi:MAG: hypothetical protein K6F00_05545 [Lachnospiraceae bacterium]|nr:hypothetical protein [Lachnospiraceae bacterium]